MKPNQEISLKFWIAMIVFFAVVLSIPLMNSLVEKSIISYADIVGFYFVCFVSALCFYMILVLRHSELKSKFNKESFFKTASTQTITDYDNKIKAQESNMNELKQAFKGVVSENTELRSNKSVSEDELRIAYERIEAMSQGNRLLINTNNELKQQIAYWKERALHQKHTKKEVESDMWECISDNMAMFTKGIKYRDLGRKTLSSLIWLENDGHTYLTHKKNFKPVKC